ncbi:PaaI family thioesterase [Oceanobacter antarcticus]|uniref:Medium/long-chain acyl-CoA thioesterase YigI n=1 Tax=Oceanobacter antarcticus TaxID=3133425 RepID=A0ABW8NP38_9GAMM
MEAQDTGYESKTLESFGRQAVMQTLDAELSIQGPGIVSIRFPFQSRFTQQNGYIHAGIVATILDSACGYAAFTLMPQGADVLTVEFKVNLLRPAKGGALCREGNGGQARQNNFCRGSCVVQLGIWRRKTGSDHDGNYHDNVAIFKN